MFCRNCGNEVKGIAIACLKCGCNPNTGTNYCPNCGATTSENQMVCVHCGIGLQKVEKKEVPTATSNKKIHSQKDKNAAGLLALFFGSLGVHQFYLGNYASGAIRALMFAYSILFVNVTEDPAVGIAGLLTLAGLEIINFIEAIKYFVSSPEAFNKTYVQGKRSWF